MATTYSTEYQALYITKPPAKVQRQRVPMYPLEFTYTQVLAGTAGDIVYLTQLLPFSKVYLPSSAFYFEGFTAAMTLSIGYGAYTDKDGVLQAASATGLLNAVTVSNGTGIWHGGMLSTATPNDFNPTSAAVIKDFANVSAVDIFATFNDQVPGANAILHGYLMVANIG